MRRKRTWNGVVAFHVVKLLSFVALLLSNGSFRQVDVSNLFIDQWLNMSMV